MIINTFYIQGLENTINTSIHSKKYYKFKSFSQKIMSNKRQALFVPVDAVGHVNACVGLAEVLIHAGYSVTFAVSTLWAGRLTKYGIREQLLRYDDDTGDSDPAKKYSAKLISDGVIGPESTPIKNLLNITQNSMPYFVDRLADTDIMVGELLVTLKPDVVFVDQIIGLPSVVKSGIPWVLVCSCNPLYLIHDTRAPPLNSGNYIVYFKII